MKAGAPPPQSRDRADCLQVRLDRSMKAGAPPPQSPGVAVAVVRKFAGAQ